MAALSTLLAAGGALLGAVNGYKQAAQQRSAMKQAEQQAQQQARQQDEAINRANQKRPDVGQIAGANAGASLMGNAGTMLTGPTGVSSDPTQLGKQTLLGG